MKVCTLMSGSSGNAIYIETKKTRLLVDAGQTGKRITAQLKAACGIDPGLLDAVLITHAHSDHITGAGVLARRYRLPLYATEGTWCEMEPLAGPICPELRHVVSPGVSLEIKDLRIEPFPVSHDASEPVGYLCGNGKKQVGIATDLGVFSAKMEKLLRNVDCLILEANHDVDMLKNGPYPWPLKKRIAGIRGHLSNDSAGYALLKTIGENTKNVILAHLSAENNKPALALDTVNAILEKDRAAFKNTSIRVAPRYEPCLCEDI